MYTGKFARILLATATAGSLYFALASCSAPQEQASTEAAETTTQTKSAPKQDTAAQQSASITEDQAKAAALKHAKVDGDAATFTKVALGDDDGTLVYEIDFTVNDTEYDYEIDATTGEVRSYEQDTVEVSQTGTAATAGDYIGEDAALTKSLEHAGVAAGDVTTSKVSLEIDENPVIYEVEFKVGQMEYNYEIDAASGSVISFDEPELDD